MDTRMLRGEDKAALEIAAEALRSGALVAFPTDTVYGLGADARQMEAVGRLYTVKGRISAKAIPVLVGDAADLDRVAANVTEKAARLAEAFWPGPLTIIFPRHPDLPQDLSGLDTVGVRIPDHEIARSVLRKTGPLAVTSANRSGAGELCSAHAVMTELAGRIPWIVDGGETPGGTPSTVVDLSRGTLAILRAGPITEEDISQVLR